jgi:hypothetical protein
MAALAAHIGALRGQDRWGVGSVEQAFTGYQALPAPMVVNDWRAVLGDPKTLDRANAAYRDLAKKATGQPELYRLNAAIAEARKVLS